MTTRSRQVERNAELTLLALITLFARPVGLSLVHWALGVLGPLLAYRSAQRRERSLLGPFALHGGCGARYSSGPYLAICALRLRNKRKKHKKSVRGMGHVSHPKGRGVLVEEEMMSRCRRSSGRRWPLLPKSGSDREVCQGLRGGMPGEDW